MDPAGDPSRGARGDRPRGLLITLHCKGAVGGSGCARGKNFLIFPGRDFPRVLAWCKLVDATAGVSNERRKGRTDRSYEKVACYDYPSGTHTNSSASRNGGTYRSSNRPGSSGEEPIERTRGRDPWARTQGPVVTQNSLGSRQIVRGAAVLGSRGCDTPGAVSGRAANRECFSFTKVPAHPR